MASTVLDVASKLMHHARTLLQDMIPPYRYSDADLVSYMNMAFANARRLRPDLFLNNPTDIPWFSETDDLTAAVINIDQQYRLALVYFMVGQATLRDEEDVQDARAVAFMNIFTDVMTTPIAR